MHPNAQGSGSQGAGSRDECRALASGLSEIEEENGLLSDQERSLLRRTVRYLRSLLGESALSGEPAAALQQVEGRLPHPAQSDFRVSLRSRESGFGIIAMIIAAVALMGALMMAIAHGSMSNVSTVTAQSRQQTLRVQVDSLRSALVECAITWPAGDNGGTNPPYPAGNGVLVAGLNCPGLPGSNQSLWTSSETRRAPLPPSGFGDWRYVNDANGVRITIDSTGAVDGPGVVTDLAAGMGPGEARVAAGVLTVCIVGTAPCL